MRVGIYFIIIIITIMAVDKPLKFMYNINVVVKCRDKSYIGKEILYYKKAFGNDYDGFDAFRCSRAHFVR